MCVDGTRQPIEGLVAYLRINPYLRELKMDRLRSLTATATAHARVYFSALRQDDITVYDQRAAYHCAVGPP